MKRIIALTLLLVLSVAGLTIAWGGKTAVQAQTIETAGLTEGTAFVHVATADNISLDVTYIDHPLTNSQPGAIIFVTQNYNPASTGFSVYNDHEVGVYYSGDDEKWSIYNEDGADMPEGAAFNVWIPGAGANAYVHTTTAENNSLNWTDLDNPASNNEPNAIVFAIHNYNPGGGGGNYHPHVLGVWYSGARWAIFNQDIVNMAEGLDFNVLIPPADSSVYVHTADVGNTFNNYTILSHPLANGNPAAHVTVTQNWNPGGGKDGVYNDKPIGVWYTGTNWAIFNQDESNMPVGAAFNVRVYTTRLYMPAIQSD